MSSMQLDAECQVNYVKLGSMTDRLDDMYGALGVASVKVAVVGEAWWEPAIGLPLFRISHSAIYIRDNYDFNGLQFLGIWTNDRVLTKAEQVSVVTGDPEHSPLSVAIETEEFAQVWNHGFRRYREQSKARDPKGIGRDGDFVIYSNPHWICDGTLLNLGGFW